MVTLGDTSAHLYVAWSLWTTGDFDLRGFEADLRDGDGQLAYFVVEDEGRIRTIFSFFPGVMLAPAGALPHLARAMHLTRWAYAGKGLNVLLVGAC